MLVSPGTTVAPAPPLRIPRWRWALAAVLSALVLAIAWRGVDREAITDATSLGLERPWVLAGAAIAYSAAFWARAFAWRLLFRSPASVRGLHGILQCSLFLNHVMPLKVGEIARPVLASRHGVPIGEALATTVAARALDFVCLALIAGVAISAHTDDGTTGTVARLALAAVAVGGITLLSLRWRVPPALPGWIAARATSLHASLADVPLRRVALASPFGLVSWVLEGAVLAAAASLFDADLSWRVAIGATAFTILFQAIHITPGGLGVYEASMTTVLVSQGVPPEQALALAVFTHAMKFAYSLSVGAAFAMAEGVSMLRPRAGEAPKRASRIEVMTARLWNVVNEGKPFTLVFTAAILALLTLTGWSSSRGAFESALGLTAIVPLALLFWRFDFPLKLRSALWVYLALFVVATRAFPLVPVVLTLSLYFGFTVVLWGTIYYHLRIGTRWSNGLRFARLVCENPDPTSGNMLEQVPKVLLLVFAFEHVASAGSASASGFALAFTAAVAVSALLLHQWFFTWVPALPQPRIPVVPAAIPAARARRVIAIVIDGCRADRLDEAATPCIDRLRAGGTEYRDMSTVYPARTVTCFSSMLTGASPARHGMHSNFVPDLGIKCESVFDVLRQHGRTGTLVGIAHLIDAFGERDVRTVTAVMNNDDIDDALIAEAKAVMRAGAPDLLVLQLLSVDQTGHARGSYNAEYLAKIEETDGKIDAFLGWCESEGYLDDATVLITADHGQGIGIGGHGHMSPPEIRIPCVLWGAGVAPAVVHQQPVFITDIAATICGALGVPGPSASIGRDLLGAPREPTGPVVFVIPARDEEQNLSQVLAAVAASGVANSRVVVVDDGSTDGTARVARDAGAIVYSHPESRGLGAALRSGLAVARAFEPRAVVYLDADGEYDAREAHRLLAPIEAGEADYVLGSRFRGTAEGMTRSRRFANALFSGVLSCLCGRRISDGQTGFRAFSARAADIAEIVHDYNYAQVLTLDLLHKGMRMVEVPVSYHRRSRGASFISPAYLWRVPLGMMREMLRA